MNFEDGTCLWEDMSGHFEISRHSLQMYIPMRDDGDIDCANASGERKYPRLDYSKGFPDWWHLDRTDIKVPSEHTQQGKRYAAEVVLSHFYELDHYKNQIGYVSLFMQDYPDERPWHYLDKLICQWRREEEKLRSDCGLPPAPVYKMCELYRGQERSPEDIEYILEEGETPTVEAPGEVPQLERPNPIPIQNLGPNPDDSMFPLQLCQGDCDFSQDCAPGLICHRREAFGAVPGCIGGETDPGDSDYCVFDPFGSGFTVPTPSPTLSPTVTSRPTIPQLESLPLVDFGGTPPLTMFPLPRCAGDCDFDSECAEGLICFQRGAFEPVPGCTGGELDDKMTDYCILDPFGSGFDDSTTSAPAVAPIALPVPVVPTAATASPSVSSAATEAPVAPVTASPVATAVNETMSPTPVPGPVGPPKPVWNRGWEPGFLLDNCEGDCDEDSDCLPGLKCFSRETAGAAVPGCFGGDEDSTLTDYCYIPGADTDLDATADPDGRLDTASPTSAPITSAPISAETSAPSVPSDGLPVTPAPQSGPVLLNPVGWSPEDQKPLGLCQGDCDDDSDCQPGLVCFQRFLPQTAVPGCIGGELDSSLMDFCILASEAAPSVPGDATSAPVEATPVPADVTSAPVAPGETAPPVASPTSDVPPPIDCDAYQGDRICGFDEDACCQDPRSSSSYCHGVYAFAGNDIYSACHHCCLEDSRGEALKVGPPNEIRDDLEPYEECDSLSNSARLCKEGGCCEDESAETEYCQGEFNDIGLENVQRVCWYCCFPSKDYNPLARRELSASQVSHEAAFEMEGRTVVTTEEMRQFHKNNPRELGPDDVIFEDSTGRKMIVRSENFGEKGNKDEDAYFAEMHTEFQRRQLQTPMMENYDDVYWWPYEWLLKVGTEYYFRYEGSMTVPPCYTVNHWRVMKDPIRVAEHQIRELERIMAWRINADCDASTAGKPREDNPDAVDVNRPLQELEKGHRLVFCECQDWPSKFPQDREWCNKWQTREPDIRLFENPYNWPQDGF